MKMWLKILIVAVLLLALGVGGWFMFRTKPETVRTVVVKKQSVTQAITYTGRMQSVKASNLSFETVGVVDNLFVEIGAEVTTGQPLAHLNTSAASIQLAKAFADKASSQEQKKITWENAEVSFEKLKAQNARSLETKRQAVRDTKIELDQDRKVHQQSAIENGDESVTTQAYVNAVNMGETAYHAAQQALAEAEKSVNKTEEDAKRAAELTRTQYQATIQAAGNVPGLSSLEATEALARDSLVKKTLLAPFDGIVTNITKELGETVTTGETVVTVETTGDLEIVANVTETDAAKVTTGMTATITFDALPPQDEWSGVVTKISPGAKIIEGVPTYEITLKIDKEDARFKPGLTANVTVHAAQVDDVLVIPRRAISIRDKGQFVWVKQADGQFKEREIQTGLVGSIGTIEIISGLSEGQEVVIDTTFLQEK